jgi:hypothetical protein
MTLRFAGGCCCGCLHQNLKIWQTAIFGKGLKCMVLDDMEKTGKRIEKVSRVFDHVTTLGFKLLLMGYWDGVSFIPVILACTVNWVKPFGLKKKN